MRPSARILLGALLVAVAASCRDDEPVSTGTADAGSEPALEPDVEWDGAVLEADGVTLSLEVGSSGPGDGPCAQNFEHAVVQEDERVVIAVHEVPPAETTSTTAMVVCDAMLRPQTIEVTLDEPLGDRPVFDGIRAEPRTVWDKSELATATWLPEGFASEGDPITGVGADGHGWQQMFLADGADWYVNVVQAPEGSLRCSEEQVDTTTVHGIVAAICDGMSGTMRTIQWSEDGHDLQVWGEMQGPPTFTHDDELQQIAEGVALPS